MTSSTDVDAVRGTSRYFREWLCAHQVTQTEFGGLCVPPASQPWVSQFDHGQFKLSRASATRVAAAVAELAKMDKSAAVREVWRMWFKNVETYGTGLMKRRADNLRKTVLSDIPAIEHTPIFDPKQNPVLGENLIGSADVRELTPEIAERDRRKAREA